MNFENINNLTNLDLSEINPSGIGHSKYMNDETRELLEIININSNLTKLDMGNYQELTRFYSRYCESKKLYKIFV